MKNPPTLRPEGSSKGNTKKESSNTLSPRLFIAARRGREAPELQPLTRQVQLHHSHLEGPQETLDTENRTPSPKVKAAVEEPQGENPEVKTKKEKKRKPRLQLLLLLFPTWGLERKLFN